MSDTCLPICTHRSWKCCFCLYLHIKTQIIQGQMITIWFFFVRTACWLEVKRIATHVVFQSAAIRAKSWHWQATEDWRSSLFYSTLRTWLIQMGHKTLIQSSASFKCITRFLHMCHVTHSKVCHDSFIRVKWLVESVYCSTWTRLRKIWQGKACPQGLIQACLNSDEVSCSVLHCVAMCCSVLCVAVCSSAYPYWLIRACHNSIAACCSVS